MHFYGPYPAFHIIPMSNPISRTPGGLIGGGHY